MKRKSLLGCALIVLVCALLAQGMRFPAAGQTPPQTDTTPPFLKDAQTIPFEYDRILLPWMVVQVRINGSQPLRFIVDTGVSAPFIMEQEAARKLNLSLAGEKSNIETDHASVTVVDLQSIEIIGATAKDNIRQSGVSGYIVGMKAMRDFGIAGLIGVPMLADRVIQGDFSAKQLRFAPASPYSVEIPEAASVPLTKDNDVYFVPVSSPAGASTLLMLDTGSYTTQVLQGTIHDSRPLAAYDALNSSVNAIHITSRFLLPSLRIGNLDIPEVLAEAVLIDHPPTLGPILGMNVLSRCLVTIDFPHCKMFLQPGKDFLRPPQRGWTGISLKMQDKRYYIEAIASDSPARQTAVQKGDELLDIDGHPVSGLIFFSVGGMLIGTAHTQAILTLQHRNGETYTAQFLRDDARQHSHSIGIIADKQGNGPMTIAYVFPKSRAERAGLQSGDEILAINGLSLADTELASLAIQLDQPKITLTVKREGEDKPRVFKM